MDEVFLLGVSFKVISLRQSNYPIVLVRPSKGIATGDNCTKGFDRQTVSCTSQVQETSRQSNAYLYLESVNSFTVDGD